MPALSPARASVPTLDPLPLLNRGKVRDSYDLGHGNMLIYATDAISIFDFVLNALVPGKGMILTAMSHFWLSRIEHRLGIKTHLIAAGSHIDEYVPSSFWHIAHVQSRAMVVGKLKMAPVEFIARGFLTGSGLKSYTETGTVCGIALPPGLQDGDELSDAIATPTTKAQEGHDEPLNAVAVQQKYPEETELLLKIYEYAVQTARRRGVILADTKLEFGRDEFGDVVLGDEALTPDSSRFWDADVWQGGRSLATRRAPAPFDKQLVREWGIEQGINKLDPLNPEHVAHVQSLVVPEQLILKTAKTYRHIFERLTGKELEEYFFHELGVRL